MRSVEDKAFLLLLVAVSFAFFWIVWQFYGAVLWAVVIAVLFAPLNRQLLKSMQNGRNLAALASVAIIVFMVILPFGLLISALLTEASAVFESIRSGQFALGPIIEHLMGALPDWMTNLLSWFGLTNVTAVQQRLSNTLGGAGQFIAERLLNLGQGTAEFFINLFIMLYLLFFLFRDGPELLRRVTRAIPLQPEQKSAIAEEFTLVVRATVKGNIIVAIVQGTLGGVMFWLLGIHAALLWGALMALLSLLPAVGSALIWLPVAIYLLLTGAIWQGIVLIVYGALVIGLIDNFLRPVLVGRDTQMPDYVVLIATLGGIVIFGINGFILGPLIAAMFITLWNIYSKPRHMRA
jgi:predicted PurR-regulated permease PerM